MIQFFDPQERIRKRKEERRKAKVEQVQGQVEENIKEKEEELKSEEERMKAEEVRRENDGKRERKRVSERWGLRKILGNKRGKEIEIKNYRGEKRREKL